MVSTQTSMQARERAKESDDYHQIAPDRGRTGGDVPRLDSRRALWRMENAPSPAAESARMAAMRAVKAARAAPPPPAPSAAQAQPPISKSGPSVEGPKPAATGSKPNRATGPAHQPTSSKPSSHQAHKQPPCIKSASMAEPPPPPPPAPPPAPKGQQPRPSARAGSDRTRSPLPPRRPASEVRVGAADPDPEAAPLLPSSSTEAVALSAAAKPGLRLPPAEPRQCKLEGAGLREGAVRREARFTIEAFTDDGLRQDHGGEPFQVAVRSSGVRLRVKLQDHEDGMYTASFKPEATGRYEISVTLCGHPLPGSPFGYVAHASVPVASLCGVVGGALTLAVSRVRPYGGSHNACIRR